MAITINGTDISANRLNSSNITLESLDGTKVFPTATWRAVSIGERVSYVGMSNTYYRGIYSSTPPSASGPTPMFAIKSDGSQYAYINIGSFWIIDNTPVSPSGTTLPSNPSDGDMFFRINDGLYIAEE